MDSEYLKHWYKKTAETRMQKLADGVVHWRTGLTSRHEYFLYRLLRLPHYPDQVKLLEIGAGSGWALSYEQPGLTKYVIDRDNFFQGELESLGATFLQADIESLSPDDFPVAFRAFDLIVLNHIIEHIWDVDAFVHLLSTLIKPGGCIYVRTPDIVRVKFKFYGDYTHVRPFCRSSLSQLFQSHGIVPLRVGNTSSALSYLPLVLPDNQANAIQDRFGKDIEGLFRK